MTNTHTSTRSLQLWPSGRTITYRDAPNGGYAVLDDSKMFKPADDATRRDIDIALMAERLQRDEVLRCQSSLIDDLLQLADSPHTIGSEFTLDNVVNLTPDPSEWDVDTCRDY